MPTWLRRLGWTAAFAALAARAYKGLSKLDEPLPQDQPADWPPLAFEGSPDSAAGRHPA